MAARWTTADMPDQSGRLAVVTGASSGIGRQTARELARKGARVILAVRDIEKGETVATELRAAAPAGAIEVAPLDLASLASITNFAENLLAAEGRLDLLIANAGVMMTPFARTADGFEMQIGTNHLGHYALTAGLVPLLARTPGSRVVIVSSIAHNWGEIDLADLNWERRGYNRGRAYCDSKLANLLFMRELNERIARRGGGPIALAAHPGWTATALQKHSIGMRIGNRVFGQSAADGALPTLRAATDPEARANDFFGPSRLKELRGPPVRVEMNARAANEGRAEALWAASEQLTGVSC